MAYSLLFKLSFLFPKRCLMSSWSHKSFPQTLSDAQFCRICHWKVSDPTPSPKSYDTNYLHMDLWYISLSVASRLGHLTFTYFFTPNEFSETKFYKNTVLSFYRIQEIKPSFFSLTFRDLVIPTLPLFCPGYASV